MHLSTLILLIKMKQYCHCYVCGGEYYKLVDWVKHFFTQHASGLTINDFTCNGCGLTHNNVMEFMLHFLVKHSCNYVKCMKCQFMTSKFHSEFIHECEMCPNCDEILWHCKCPAEPTEPITDDDTE